MGAISYKNHINNQHGGDFTAIVIKCPPCKLIFSKIFLIEICVKKINFNNNKHMKRKKIITTHFERNLLSNKTHFGLKMGSYPIVHICRIHTGKKFKHLISKVL